MFTLKIKKPSLSSKRITFQINPERMTLVPMITVLVLMSFICFALSDLFPFLSYASLGITLLSFFTYSFLIIRKRIITSYTFLIALTLLSLISVTVTNVQDIKNSVYDTCAILLYVFLLQYYIGRFQFILTCFAIALSFCVYVNFLHLLTHPALWMTLKDSSGYLLGGNYNQMGIRMIVALGINTLCVNYSKLWLFNLIPLLIICFISLTLLGSMTALASFTLITLIYIIPNKFLQKIAVVTLLIFVVLFQVFIVFNGKGIENNELAVYFIEEILNKDITFTGRTRLWDSAIRIITDSPVWGYGYVNTTWFITKMDSFAMGPHNMILAILINGGMILLMLYCALLHKSYHYIKPYLNKRPTILFAACIVTSLFMSLMEMYQYPIILLMPSVAYFYAYSQKNIKETRI